MIRIGISILTKAGISFWSNGIGQNAIHLARTFQASRCVERVFLIDVGDGSPLDADARDAVAGLPILSAREAAETVDIAIEVSGGLDIQWIRHVRARGGKIIHYLCGQPYSVLVEPSIFDKQCYWAPPDRMDEIWLLPKDAHFAPFLRSLHRRPVHVTPYLWSPAFLDGVIASMGAEGAQFGYRRGQLWPNAPARIAVFEPNISPIKCGVIPSMICDVAKRRAPERIAALHLLNAAHLQGQATFDFFRRNLDIERAGQLHIGPRDYFARVMAKHANIVVSHQMDCTQNYLYLDALYGAYPLIHNSPLFADVGYYYKDSDIEAGAERLLEAIETHDAELDGYARKAKACIAGLDPAHPRNVDAYARRALALIFGERI